MVNFMNCWKAQVNGKYEILWPIWTVEEPTPAPACMTDAAPHQSQFYVEEMIKVGVNAKCFEGLHTSVHDFETPQVKQALYHSHSYPAQYSFWYLAIPVQRPTWNHVKLACYINPLWMINSVLNVTVNL